MSRRDVFWEMEADSLEKDGVRVDVMRRVVRKSAPDMKPIWTVVVELEATAPKKEITFRTRKAAERYYLTGPSCLEILRGAQ